LPKTLKGKIWGHITMHDKPWLTKYPSAVPRQITIRQAALWELMQSAAERYQESVATIFYGAKLKYSDLIEGVARTGGFLQAVGVNPSDRVAILMPNVPSFIMAFYGTIFVGGTVVPLNPLLSTNELEFQLIDSGAETLIVAEALVEKVAPILIRTLVKRVVVSSISHYVPIYLRPVVALKCRHHSNVAIHIPVYKLEAELRTAPKTKPYPAKLNDPAVLLYTGGTTGICKAAILTHFNLVANVDQIRAWLYALQPAREVVACVLPFFHSYGMTVGMNLAVDMAAAMVLLPKFDPLETVRAIHKYRVTLLPGVPSMYMAIARTAQRNKIDISSVKVCVSGGAPLIREIYEKFVSVTGAKLVEGYGLTEASPVTHVNPIWDSENRIGSIGLPIPNTDCRIVDLQTGTKDLAPGEEGELIIRGPQIMAGYWNRPQETTQTIRDGWLYTGDIATMDPDGYFRIVDRKKDMIIVGGFNVYPREVEEVIAKHPCVEECAVIGELHPLRGELVKAYIVLRKGAHPEPHEIIAFCRQHLAIYKVPRSIEFVSELPKTAVGKILRRELRKSAQEISN